MTSVTHAGLAQRLQIPERDWMVVAGILQQHLAGKTVWAFGSRATGKRVKPFSDLDLAVPGTLTSAQRAALNEAFDESMLNFKVDVVEMEMVEADFKERIERDFVVLQNGT